MGVKTAIETLFPTNVFRSGQHAAGFINTNACFCVSSRDYLTSKGQGQNMTSGQGHVMTKIGHVAYQSTRLDETTQ